MNIFETLSKLSGKSKRKEPCYISLDEETNQIKEIPLSSLDSSASAYINYRDYNYKNPAKLIHDSIFQ